MSKMISKGIPNLKSNFLINTLYEILRIIVPFVTAPYLARVLGAEKIGINSFVYSVQTYFCMLATLGTVAYGTREIARVRDSIEDRSKYFWEIELLSIITSFISICFWIIFIFINNNHEYKIFYIILTLGLFNSMFDIAWFFAGMEQFKYIVSKNTFVKILEVILIFILVKNENHLLRYIIIHSTCVLFGTLSMWIPIRKLIQKVSIKELNVLKHIKETFIYFIPTIASSIYTVLDKTLIGLITKDNAQNGYYDQAEKIIQFVKIITFGSLNTVVGSRSTYLYSHKKFDEIKDRINKSVDYILLLGTGFCFGLIGCADNFVPIFFGSGYENVAVIIKILSPIVIIIGLSGTLGAQFYTPAGLRLKSAIYLLIGAGLNLICNLILIPSFKSVGAAVGSIIAEITITFLYIKNCDGFYSMKHLLSVSWKRFTAGILMLVYLITISHFIGNSNLCIVIQFFGGVIIYFVLLWTLKDKFLRDYLFPKLTSKKNSN